MAHEPLVLRVVVGDTRKGRAEAESGRELANRAEMEIWSQVEDSNRFPEDIQESEIFQGTRRLVIRIFPYVVFIRKTDSGLWEVLDVVHTARMLPKGSG